MNGFCLFILNGERSKIYFALDKGRVELEKIKKLAGPGKQISLRRSGREHDMAISEYLSSIDSTLSTSFFSLFGLDMIGS